MKFLISLLLAASASSVYALDCKTASATPELNECAAIEQKKVEDQLNQIYQRSIKAIDEPDTKKALIAAQRAWIKFREADCKAVYERYKQGTARTMMFIGCMRGHAENRIKDLADFQYGGS
ncbi:DUF1311 domain-containing protein [Duganella sp. sic0402]|uniref:lysozyme inhibitor LprI family protein n=1 Tax=Duganella sp. sic0402 TaxID=2854786 RepID=UPI001C43A2B5|nr:lysozyme inhibitor LprI family protein [Duganella sp. sic0402]MBV7536705.1 DUF1311 domain-containing protein [Duganella sp. sic0402]